MSTGQALICQTRMPEFDRDRGSQRVIELIEFLQEAGWGVTFVAQNGTGGERYLRMLQQRGVAAFAGAEQLERLLTTGRFDLAILAFWHVAEAFLPTIRALSPATRIVIDSIDLHFLRSARRTFHRLAENDSPEMLDAAYASEMIREINTYAVADAVLAVSQKEADLINDLTGSRSLAHVVPLSEDLPLLGTRFAQRQGILFCGNFRHLPNTEAVGFLCNEVLPRMDSALLSEHPVYIVGHALHDKVRRYGEHLPQVRMVGWVPSLIPYLERARITVVPLLHGAGVKGKLIQTLMAGTPAVSTSIGTEGLHLRHGEHLLVADDATAFADAMTRLLTDARLWRQLARHGRAHAAAMHDRGAVRARFLDVLATVLAQPPKPEALAQCYAAHRHQITEPYQSLIRRMRQVVAETLPPRAVVAVVSKGDSQLLQLDGRRAWHFPQGEGGVYAGHYPADSAAAIAHLEELRERGAEYLLFPQTGFWWLSHYTEFSQHLEDHYQLAVDRQDACLIYALGNAPHAPQSTERNGSARERQPAAARAAQMDSPPAGGNASRPKVLVAGTYAAHAPISVERIAAALARSQKYDVVQRWVAVGDAAPSGLAHLTAKVVAEGTPRASALRALLNAEPRGYEYVLAVADGVVLPDDFADRFFTLQASLGFALAQPARAGTAPSGYPITERQRGVLARQTLYVDTAPVVSIHRSAYALTLPFVTRPAADADDPGHALSQQGLKLGIIDDTPVQYLGEGGRLPAAGNTGEATPRPWEPPAIERRLAVLDVFNAVDGRVQSESFGAGGTQPLISVVIATYNRAELLAAALASFKNQSVPQAQYEVVVVDDGSTDATREVCRRLVDQLPLRYLRIAHAGRSAAKNLGIFAAKGDIVFLFDDDDVATPDLLAEHLRMHRQHPEETVAVLGYTTWSPSLNVTPVMKHITDVDQFLFAYRDLQDGQVLDWRHFWEGRLSCKRSLLVKHGVHNQKLQYTIDIELGYRLSKRGLKVIYNRRAISHMMRPVTFADFCQRCEAKGRAQYRFSRLYPDDPVIREYCQVIGAEKAWQDIGPVLEGKIRRVHELERLLAAPSQRPADDARLQELNKLYRWAFNAFKTKGIVEAMRAEKPAATTAKAAPPTAKPKFSIIIPVWNVTAELAEMTARYLERIWAVQQVALETILIDQGSLHKQPYRTSILLEYKENRGIPFAWNAGADAARGDVLCFLNNDVWVEPGWDASLCAAALDGRRIAFPYTDHGDGLGPRRPDTAGVAGWCFALSRQVYNEVGRFDENFNPAFFEDTDYFHRAWQLGVELSPVPTAMVQHVRRTTAQKHERMTWLFQAHRFKYGWKHGVAPDAKPPFYEREIVEYRPPQRQPVA